MSTSSTIADSSAPSANHTLIRVGLIGVGKLGFERPRSRAQPYAAI
jgi:predicted homoserine dehydrogenase-like protein